ncbi:MAG: ParB/RepB/Spo0J family partition protein [Patescibacteria group bacterium]
MPNPSLGRGLDALLSRKIPPSTIPPVQNIPVAGSADEKVYELPVDVIAANPSQPRSEFADDQLRELAESIREYGIIQPLVVSKQSSGDYTLIAGERRLRAAKSIGLKMVPVVLRNTDEHERLAVALIENIQRVDLNPMELALAYQRLLDEFNFSHTELGKKLGKSRPVISNTLRFFNLHPKIQEALREKRLDSGQGKIILSLNNHDQQLSLYNQIMKENLSVAESTRRLRQMSVRHAEMAGAKQPDIVRKEDLLREYLGTKVDISMRAGKGHIRIEFFSPEELTDIMQKIVD